MNTSDPDGTIVSSSFRRLGGVSFLVQRYLPAAFIFALLLTFATIVLAMAFTPNGPGEGPHPLE